MTTQAHAESVLGRVEWETSTRGFCRCPGEHLHHTPTRRRDCRVCIDGAPTVHCLHASCAGPVADANRRLRARDARRDNGHALPRVARPDPVAILRAAWDPDARWLSTVPPFDHEGLLASMSPIELPDDPREHFSLFMDRMWADDDIVWSGEVEDSGRPEMSCHWRRAADCDVPLGRFTSGSTYQPDTVSRAAANVHTARYLVLESDVLRPGQMVALAALLAAGSLKLRLRAMVWTGGKSIHVWFARPAESIVRNLKIAAPVVGLDPKTFHATQPVRMPGVERDGDRWQRCLYMDAYPTPAPWADILQYIKTKTLCLGGQRA
jgi:hypothetical protein